MKIYLKKKERKKETSRRARQSGGRRARRRARRRGAPCISNTPAISTPHTVHHTPHATPHTNTHRVSSTPLPLLFDVHGQRLLPAVHEGRHSVQVRVAVDGEQRAEDFVFHARRVLETRLNEPSIVPSIVNSGE